MIDGTKLGQAAAELMERIEGRYEEDAELKSVLVVAEIAYADEDGDKMTNVEWEPTDRPVVGAGLAQMVISGMTDGRHIHAEEDE